MRLRILDDKSGPIAFWLFWAFCVIATAAFWLVVASVASADPFTVTPTGTIPLVTYTEPTTYTSGLALTDLKETQIYWKVGIGVESTVVVPASKATGGGVITNSVILAPILPCQSGIINVAVSAMSVSGGEGTRAAAAPLVVDRTKEATCVIPSAPTGVTVQ